MRQPLVIAVAQPACVALDVAANAAEHAAIVRRAGARFVVFPEMSLTGYEFDAPAVQADDPRLAPLVEACAETGTLALAGAPVGGAGGMRHIGVLAIDGTGARVVYRKVWLGAEEAARFAPGAGPVVLDVDGWRLGLAVCRDTGVMQHATDTAALGMDAYVAGVLEKAEDAAVPGERARRVAADHGVWVAIASFAGPTGEGYADAAGGSGIWHPDGGAVVEAGRDVGEVLRATIT
jgi:predicted amidohydrolase